MDNTTHSIIHNLNQLRKPFEFSVNRHEVVGLGAREEFLKPTLYIKGQRSIRIESIEDVANAWPEDDRKVELIWAHDGSALIGRIDSKPVTKHAGKWQCDIQPRAMRDGKMIATIDIPIDVEFDDCRPPQRLIDHLIFKVQNQTSL